LRVKQGPSEGADWLMGTGYVQVIRGVASEGPAEVILGAG